MKKRRVIFIVLSGVEILDLTGPIQAFHEAIAFGAPYSLLVCAANREVRTAQGLEIASLAPLPDTIEAEDWIFIPGYSLGKTKIPLRILEYLRKADAAKIRICSVCVGAFVLGEAGLLRQRKCTTHWRHASDLQDQFPSAQVLGDRLFVEDGNIFTSAGVAAGIDMALYLIERDKGPALASAIARDMVIYIRRDGSQAQESAYLNYQTHLNPGVHRVQHHLNSNPASPAGLSELANIAHMSTRHLTRTFRRVTGITIQEYRNRLRLELAAQLMRNSKWKLERIAEHCGFADIRQLRRIWKSTHGTSLGTSRRQLRQNATPPL